MKDASMKWSPHRIPSVRALIDDDLPAGELERLARVDALLRVVRPPLHLVATPESTRQEPDEERHELKLTFRELSLIYSSLQAAKTLRALPPQDELLEDTILLVDQALQGALR
jgi:hypothetical protein